jgi:hypothetical protein
MDLKFQVMIHVGRPVEEVFEAVADPKQLSSYFTTGGASGRLEPGKMGGHVRPKIAGEHRAWLLQRTGQADFTIRGLVAELAERGLRVDYRTVWKFVHREGLSFKKNGAGGRTGPARRGPQAGPMEDASGQA